ncbi:MAG: UvrD-helicase domain-containing protein, partial [Oscillospiraceae bacterium]|nr:UvrD-helicase domain-containing protein [Oscillospiraceae bacterium]
MTCSEFKTQYQIRLNPQQEAAVRQVDGPVLLLAVPGSGKTTVLVTRLGYMIYCKGIRPENILTVYVTVR